MKKLILLLTILLVPGLVWGLPPSAPTKATHSKTSTANFGGNLSSADTTVQAALDTLDDVVLGGETTETIQDNNSR
jgi:hypothetical protein